MLGHPRRHRHPNDVVRVPLSTFVPYRTRSHPPPPSNPNTHRPPPPGLFECNRSSPAFIISNRAWTLTSRFHRVHSSAIARPPLPSSPFQPERLFTILTMFIRARSLVSRLHGLNSSQNARFAPPPYPFERDHSSPVCSVSIRAIMLISHIHRVDSSQNARFSARPYLFELSRSSPTSIISIRAQTRASALVPWPHRVHLGATTRFFATSTRFPASLCSFKRRRTSAHLDMSIQARPLSPTWRHQCYGANMTRTRTT